MSEYLQQQGDVLILAVDKIPEGATVLNNGGVLVKGDHTGHSHVVSGDFEVSEAIDGTMYLKTSSTCTISHEEHAAQEIPAGLFMINQVKEYDHFTEEARAVED